MKGLEGKICIITGAGQGIGRAIAERFSAEQAVVIAANRNVDRGEEVVATIRSLGGEARFVQTDIREPADCEQLIEAVIDEFGRIDVLVNNAAVGLLRTVEETTLDEYAYIMDTNVRGAFLLCKHALPHMTRAGNGAIVNIASVASFVGFERDAAYCASKGALLMLTRQMALDYAAAGIRVNAVCPGFIATPEITHYVEQQADPAAALRECVAMHPAGRIGEPHEVAAVVAFLASDEAPFVTGASLVIDGGLMTR